MTGYTRLRLHQGAVRAAEADRIEAAQTSAPVSLSDAQARKLRRLQVGPLYASSKDRSLGVLAKLGYAEVKTSAPGGSPVWTATAEGRAVKVGV